MKQLLVIVVIAIGFCQAIKAENLSLVQENLNKEIYAFDHKVIRFILSKNQLVAHLSISNTPSAVLNAFYDLKKVTINNCGIKTYISNTVELEGDRQFAQIRVTDYSDATCDKLYEADVKVELKDTKVNAGSNKVEIYYSSLLFDYIRPRSAEPVIPKE